MKVLIGLAYFKILLHFKNIKEETIVRHFCTRRSQDQPAFAGLTLNRRLDAGTLRALIAGKYSSSHVRPCYHWRSHGWARAHPTSTRVGREICTNSRSFFRGVRVGGGLQTPHETEGTPYIYTYYEHINHMSLYSLLYFHF